MSDSARPLVIVGSYCWPSPATRVNTWSAADHDRGWWFDGAVTSSHESEHVVTASRDIAAPAEKIFELIADPELQPRWDGNDNLSEAAPGQRVRAVGDAFLMTTTTGNVRENHVFEFVEGRRIAWRPSA